MKKGLVFVMTAPSGCGKGTLRKGLLVRQPHLKFCPSVTTRSPRPGEVDGADYIFVSEQEFMEKRDRQELAEWAKVYGNYYGTPKDGIEGALKRGMAVLLEKDIQGARVLREAYPEGIFIFILPPSLEELERRIQRRGTENSKEQRLRLESARHEIADLTDFDYVIINEDIHRATDRLVAVTMGELARHKYFRSGPKGRSKNDKPITERCGERDGFQIHSSACGGQACQTNSARTRGRSSGDTKTGIHRHRRDTQGQCEV